jgi:crossover junction endodeoxyribonuclease RuvC
MKVIGIDPGLSATGVGIVSGLGLRIEGYSFGSIHTSTNNSIASRLTTIYSKLLSLLQDEKPDLMVIEDVFSLPRYPRSGITLGQVTGVIYLAGFEVNVPVIEVSVREAKKILTGNGNAGKLQLERAVRNRLKLTKPIRPTHASDAMGLALIGLFRYENHLGNIQIGVKRRRESGGREMS